MIMVFIMGQFGKILLFILMSFWCGSFMNANEIRHPEYSKYVSEVIRDSTNEMEKEYGVFCVGSGGSMPDDVEVFSIRYVAYQKASIEQARELEVNAIQKLLQKINTHANLRPFLREYPFSVPRADVSIAFENKKSGNFYDDGSVARVTQIGNKIYYRALNPTTNQFIPLAEEPYEEALKKVRIAQSTK